VRRFIAAFPPFSATTKPRPISFVLLDDPPVEQEPLVVDWDDLEARRDRVFPQHRHRELVAT